MCISMLTRRHLDLGLSSAACALDRHEHQRVGNEARPAASATAARQAWCWGVGILVLDATLNMAVGKVHERTAVAEGGGPLGISGRDATAAPRREPAGGEIRGVWRAGHARTPSQADHLHLVKRLALIAGIAGVEVVC